MFSNIEKAVGGHKYLRRERVATGYRYFYTQERGRTKGKARHVLNYDAKRSNLSNVLRQAMERSKKGYTKEGWQALESAYASIKEWKSKQRERIINEFGGMRAVTTDIGLQRNKALKRLDSQEKNLNSMVMAVQDKLRRGQIAGARETAIPSKKSVTEWEDRFPEIAKAVGAQRGGKYLKRVPKSGGGYRYVYHSEKHRVAHQAEGMKRRAKKLRERARSLEQNDMLAQASKARGKADLLMKMARMAGKKTVAFAFASLVVFAIHCGGGGVEGGGTELVGPPPVDPGPSYIISGTVTSPAGWGEIVVFDVRHEGERTVGGSSSGVQALYPCDNVMCDCEGTCMFQISEYSGIYEFTVYIASVYGDYASAPTSRTVVVDGDVTGQDFQINIE